MVGLTLGILHCTGNGEVVAGRHINKKTEHHCKNHNRGSIGICVTGNTSNEAPSTAQLESLWGKIKMLMDEYNLDRRNVYLPQGFRCNRVSG